MPEVRTLKIPSSVPLSYDLILSYSQMLWRTLQLALKMIPCKQYSAKKTISVARAPVWSTHCWSPFLIQHS